MMVPPISPVMPTAAPITPITTAIIMGVELVSPELSAGEEREETMLTA